MIRRGGFMLGKPSNCERTSKIISKLAVSKIRLVFISELSLKNDKLKNT